LYVCNRRLRRHRFTNVRVIATTTCTRCLHLPKTQYLMLVTLLTKCVIKKHRDYTITRTNLQVTSHNLINISGKQRRATDCNGKTLNRIRPQRDRELIDRYLRIWVLCFFLFNNIIWFNIILCARVYVCMCVCVWAMSIKAAGSKSAVGNIISCN